jgi:HD-GYP domain-containing protein (c-di-GMP phosphodiesterase class II)/putative methionine-R-sulfoxide reductase with GAF domain
MTRDNRLRVYIWAVLALGVLVVSTSLLPPRFDHGHQFFVFLGVVLIASTIKIKLPGMSGSLSPGVIPILVGISELTVTEAVLIGCAASLTQYIWHAKKRPRLLQLSFNVAVIAISVGCSSTILHRIRGWHELSEPVAFAVLALTYFGMNTMPICTAIALSGRAKILDVWIECYATTFPTFMISAAAGAMYSVSTGSKWAACAMLAPLLYAVYRAHWLFLGRLQQEKANVAESAALNLRAMEALVAAIETRDGTAYSDPGFIQTFVTDIGKQLQLPDDEMKALASAALLRDIGKMAIPDRLLARPGKLTRAEMEKVEKHVLASVDILERVHFPFPVLPIVRAHHEKWDGTGYPDGLKGEQIPLGGRILAVVDALVGMTSDRPHRAAMPIEAAVTTIVSEAGRCFDPAVVEILQRRYRDLEVVATRTPNVTLAQAGSFESSVASLQSSLGLSERPGGGQLHSISKARHENEVLAPSDTFLTLKESLAVFAIRLNRAVPYDTIAVYLVRGERLIPEYVNGEEAKLFASGEIELGAGISGRVAATAKSRLNADPEEEAAALGHRPTQTKMHSALSVPLENAVGSRGVLTVYRRTENSFQNEDLRILLAIRLKVLDWELQPLASTAMLADSGN